jgi:hypothetical protein
MSSHHLLKEAGDGAGGPVVGTDVYTPAIGPGRRKVSKKKIYVDNIQDVPPGYRPRRGPRGGIYYDPAQDRAEQGLGREPEALPRLLPSKEDIHRFGLGGKYAIFRVRGGSTKVFIPAEDVEEGKHDVTRILAKLPPRARIVFRMVVPNVLWKSGFIGQEHAYIRHRPELMIVSNQLLDLADEAIVRIVLHAMGHFLLQEVRKSYPSMAIYAKQIWEKWQSIEKALDGIDVRYSLIGTELIPGGLGVLLKGYAPRSDIASRTFDEYFAESCVEYFIDPDVVPERLRSVLESLERNIANVRKRQ